MPDESKVELPPLEWTKEDAHAELMNAHYDNNNVAGMLSCRERQLLASLQREAEANDSAARANHDLKIVQDAGIALHQEAVDMLVKAEAEVQRLEKALAAAKGEKLNLSQSYAVKKK